MAMSMSTTYTGRVAAVNMRGLKLEGHDEWANFSKFAPDIIPPLKGETVTVVLDKSGFIRSVDSLDGPAPIAGASDAPGLAQGRSGPSGDKDRTITRLAVLKAAAEFAAGRAEVKSGDVLKIAESWERWILRDADDLGLVDAF